MWKKDEAMPTAQQPTPRTSNLESPVPAKKPSAETAVIGRSISIRGEVSGDEDLLIQGSVDGSVHLELQAITVGREGKVKANITGRIVTVEGEVEGDLRAQEQVILRGSAQVEGDITAPRVVLEDGASFRGLVDMGDPAEAAKRAVPAAESKPKLSSGANGSTTNVGSTSTTLGKASSGKGKDKGASSTKDADRAVS